MKNFPFAISCTPAGELTVMSWDEQVLGPQPKTVIAAQAAITAYHDNQRRVRAEVREEIMTDATKPATARVQAVLADPEACNVLLGLLGLEPSV